MKIAIVSNDTQRCGVAEFGRNTAEALKKYSRHEIALYPLKDREDYEKQFPFIENADITVYNYNPITMSFLGRGDFSRTGKPAIGLLHEFDYVNVHAVHADLFRYRIAPDPSLVSRVPGLWAIPRIVPQIKVESVKNTIFTLGSFGFAVQGKNFEEIVEFASRRFEKSRVRLQVSNASYSNDNGKMQQEIYEKCQSKLKKNVELEFCRDFLTNKEIIDFLSGNDINLFLYDEYKTGRGISAVADLAIAAERPFALSDSGMFRHIKEFAPEAFLSNSSLYCILETGAETAKRLKELWTPEAAAKAYDSIFEAVADDWKKPHTKKNNTVLTDDFREALYPQEEEIARLYPEMYKRKIPQSNVQQAFVKSKVEEFARPESTILCVGYNEDTAYFSLKEKGYRIDAIDPEFDMDLNKFHSLYGGKRFYDVIFSTSVIGHVEDDREFISQIVDFLAHGGAAVLTMNYRNTYIPGEKIPAVDYRLYTQDRILRHFVPRLKGCRLLDIPDWDYAPDFEYEGYLYGFAAMVFKKELVQDEIALSYNTNTEMMLLTRQRDEASRQRDEARNEVTEQKNAINGMAQLINNYAQQIDSMRKSLSWQLTRPFRVMRYIAHGDFGILKQAAMILLARFIRITKSFVKNIGLLRVKISILKQRIPSMYTNQNIFSLTQSQRPRLAGERTLYIYVEHAVSTGTNTGIQRVTRTLACVLKKMENVKFVKWSNKLGCLIYCTTSDIQYLKKFNKIVFDRKEKSFYRKEGCSPINQLFVKHGDWLVVPEVMWISSHRNLEALDLIYSARAFSLKTVFVFYDATPLKRWELACNSARHAAYMQQILLADIVIPISKYAAQELLAYFRLHEEAESKIIPEIRPLLLPGVMRKKEIGEEEQNGKFILSVGSIVPHKNQMLLAETFYRLHTLGKIGESWELHFTGAIGGASLIEAMKYSSKCKNIKFLGTVSDSHLDSLYRRCSFTVFPSVQEGYGLPITESVSYGKPCICANFGAMGEVAERGGCLTVDVRDSIKLGNAITTLINDKDLHNRLCGEAQSVHIEAWEDYARNFLQILDKHTERISAPGRVYCWVGIDDKNLISAEQIAVLESLTRQHKSIPCIWNAKLSQLREVQPEELHVFALNTLLWSCWKEPEKQDWIFVPALDKAPSDVVRQVELYSKDNDLKSAWLLLENESADFMIAIASAEKIFPVSLRAKEQYISFILSSHLRFPSLEHRLEAFALPDMEDKKALDSYTADLLYSMASDGPSCCESFVDEKIEVNPAKFYSEFFHLKPRPLLSICISTYNHADNLKFSLYNLFQILPQPNPDIEIIVCDNASTDTTSNVAAGYLSRQDFHYHRNTRNAGMLGNLRVTSHLAHGKYIWIMGADDLIYPDGAANILSQLKEHPGIALLYLNYAITSAEIPKNSYDTGAYFNTGSPIVPPSPDLHKTLAELAVNNENFFTAIYCIVVRRDHALRMFSQFTEERPFSTLASCVPTTKYTLNYMLDEEGIWLGKPQILINMNVSWLKYASLWILERVPEFLDLAEKMGVSRNGVDRWRKHNLTHSYLHFWKEMFETVDPEENFKYFSVVRSFIYFHYLDEFASIVPDLQTIYEKAYTAKHPAAQYPPHVIFSGWEEGISH
jgi:glycosyltransferase involved in cell wall biosynthesis/SAM-dependent methyltransferase